MTSYATYMLCVFIDARGLLRMAAPAIIKAGVWGVVCDVPDVTRLLSRGSIPPVFHFSSDSAYVSFSLLAQSLRRRIWGQRGKFVLRIWLRCDWWKIWCHVYHLDDVPHANKSRDSLKQ